MRSDETDAFVGRVSRRGAGAMVARPALFARLAGPSRVTVVSAPPGSGKTMLLRSWVNQAAPAERPAWVTVGRDERDPQPFWLSVVSALRRTAAGAELVRGITAAPDLDGWVIVERLLKDLAPLEDRLWLVVDDVHELSSDALGQLGLLVLRASPRLRFVLATRHDVRLGLHQLRLEGELAEIRADDLRFSLTEAGELFAAAGVELPEPALALLHQRTEGWAAGLRLASLALAGGADPGQFAAEFSGSERTVAEYLLAEALERQSEPVRQLLLRTSILERVNGELADRLTGDRGGERALQDLEAANMFVTSLDTARSWFRYHRLFAELLQLELRRTAPGEITALHSMAAGWYAGHGFGVDAIRHAQAARDWPLATRLLADHWGGLILGGQAATVRELLAGFPAQSRAADALLMALIAADEIARGSVAAAERYVALAEREPVLVPDGQRGQFELLTGSTRMLIARWHGDLPTAVDEARRFLVLAQASEAGLGQELLSGVAAHHLGLVEVWATRPEEARRNLERSVAVARRTGQPYIEYAALAHLAAASMDLSFAQAAERARQAIDLAERHGWSDEPCAGVACAILADMLAWQGRPEEAVPWVQRAERTMMTAGVEPAEKLAVLVIRGRLELALGRDADALAAFRAAGQFADVLAAPHLLATQARAWLLYSQVRLGDTERAEQTLAGLGEHDRDHCEVRIAVAALRLAQGDPQAATAALAPVLDRSESVLPWVWLAHAFLLEAIARDALGDRSGAGRAVERALDLTERDGALLWFLLHPAPGLLERHARNGTSHAALIADILSLLAGTRPAPSAPQPPIEPLSGSELRVLRYLPTNLTAPEIASELHVSINTIKAHISHLYAKLGAHRRADAVARARELGLLAPSALRAR